MLPVTKDAFGGPYQQLQLVRIYILVGEPEKAIDQLELLLKIPYRLSKLQFGVMAQSTPVTNSCCETGCMSG